MPRHDQLFKDLLRALFPNLLDLADAELAAQVAADRSSGITFLDKEVFVDFPEGRRREADLVAELSCRWPLGKLLVHVEIERRYSSTMGQRLWRYSYQLSQRYALPVVSIVVFLRGGPPGGQRIDYVEQANDWEILRFRYLSLGLSRLSAEALLDRREPLAWALAALAKPSKTGRARLKLDLLRKIAKGSVSEAQRFLLTNCVETYLQLAGRDVEEYAALRPAQANPEIEAMELTWADRMAAQYEQQGVRKGREQGVRETLLRLLGKRFGKISPAIRRRVDAIDSLEDLSGLVDRILEVKSIEELGLGK
ncbi:MAG TPA: DUF4351 domain-containing protein [Thermoanaerobaculia bacterium]|jgi:hypothetical protein|nr:DUF4351 domain-containing protein [Thermoanaerobaculia bacterium]